jgi:flavin-dependent dehydrogenase
MSHVVVIGAGPAGCVFAARMAQLGHDVTLIERVAFPRPRLGESLSAGVLPLLEMIGARASVEAAGFFRVHAVSTAWVEGESERRDPEGRGLLVDRGRFDALLLDRARTLGVRILQPANVEEFRYQDGQWRLRIACEGRRVDHAADFLADATGRSGFLRGRRARPPVTTIALYAYWRGADLPQQPRIEAGADAWYWVVPLPDGSCNTLVFLDAATLRAHRGRSLTSVLQHYLGRSQLLDPGRDLRSHRAVDAPRGRLDLSAVPVGPARAIDATPYVDEQSVASASIKIGDAAAALDPLSSSGVQKAIQTALSGAIVANTLLRRPQAHEAPMRFYRSSIARAAAQHAGWSAAQYGRVAAQRGGEFWIARAAGAAIDKPSRQERPDVTSFGETVELSPQLASVEIPCIDGDFITVKQAVSHPHLDEPVAYVGGRELRPLLDDVRSGMTPLDLARAWTDRVPLRSALQIAAWMLEHGLLVRAGCCEGLRADAHRFDH